MDVSNIEGVTQYLSFQLGEELFAIEVSHVREVLEFIKITHVPGAPEHLKGMINVRGSVVPVMDMHCKLGMPPIENSINTRIIVAELPMGDDTVVLGMIADSVKEVLDLREEDIEPPPRIGNKYNILTKGIAHSGENFIIILDIENITSGNSFKNQGMPAPGEEMPQTEAAGI